MNSGEGDMVDEAGRGRGSGRLGMSRLGALFEIDLRSLAILRIGVAVALPVDLASRVRDMDALHAARGVLFPALARSLWDRSVTLSPFTWVAESTALLWTGVFLLATAALCLALGLIPRWAAAAAWFLLAALQDRNPGLYMSGDRYLLLLLMWCILLPTGARLNHQHVTATGSWLRSQTALLAILSRAIRWTEVFGPLLVLSPWRNAAAR